MTRLQSISRGIFGALESASMAIRKFDGMHPKDPGIAKMFGFGTPTAAGVRVTHETTLALPAVYRAINIISNAVSGIPFYVFKQDKEGNRDFATGHTSWKAIAIEPNPEIKQVDFRRTMTAWAIGWGNAVAHISRPGWPNGGPVTLTPLLPDRTIPVRITERMVKKYDVAEDLLGMLYYQTRINDVEISFPASECLHIRGLGPSSYWGYDIVELLVQALGGAQARAEFGYRFYGQGANPAGFLEMPSALGEEAEKRLSESIKRGMEGMGKAHRIMVLEEGAKFHQWTVDPEKAQFLEGLQFDYRQLANIVGIKVHKLIDSANSAYASLEQANSEHRDDDLYPWIMQWTGEYNQKMLTQRQREEMSHVIDIDDEYVDGWVPFKDRAEGVVMLQNNNIITRDEGRRRLNWGPSRDRNGKRFAMPMNIEFTDDKVSLTKLAIDTAKNPPPPVRNLPAPDDDTPADDETEDTPDDDSEDDEARVMQSNTALAESMRQAEELRSAWLDKIRVRIGKQAIKLSSKSDASEFITWVDGLSTETAPGVIQAAVDELYADVRTKLLAIVDHPPKTTLADAVAEVVASWSNSNEPEIT